ncbi:MAG: BON domain-containing protein [Xenococcaceae cyanobacterium MO_167.B52]|nr:BON domain-containing protein [Xenococcaceae cyanobacterium MO_167.B52]
MKRIVPLLAFLTVTVTLLPTACKQVEPETKEPTTPSPATQAIQIEQQPAQDTLLSSEAELKKQPIQETSSSRLEVSRTIPAFRVGLDGEYDPSGLAKRVASALAEDTELREIDTIYVAQTGSTIILKGLVPNQAVLDKIVTIVQSVDGATGVETNQVQVDP